MKTVLLLGLASLLVFLVSIFLKGQGASSGASHPGENDARSVRPVQPPLPYATPGEVPYEIIPRIEKDAWAELMREGKNRKSTNVDANMFVWGHLYRLHSWFCIEVGEEGRPYCVVEGGKPMLALFTSPEMANEFIKSQRIADRYEKIGVMGHILPSTLAYLQSFENEGVEWVIFNAHAKDGGFGGPIGLLQTGYRWHLEHDSRFRKAGPTE